MHNVDTYSVSRRSTHLSYASVPQTQQQHLLQQPVHQVHLAIPVEETTMDQDQQHQQDQVGLLHQTQGLQAVPVEAELHQTQEHQVDPQHTVTVIIPVTIQMEVQADRAIRVKAISPVQIPVTLVVHPVKTSE